MQVTDEQKDQIVKVLTRQAIYSKVPWTVFLAIAYDLRDLDDLMLRAFLKSIKGKQLRNWRAYDKARAGFRYRFFRTLLEK